MQVFETSRLCVRIATPDDSAMFHALWTNPEVMRMVGFPKGLPITLEEIRVSLERVMNSSD